jgi:hypothetical protein
VPALKLQLFASAWTFGSLDACRREVAERHFEGIEGPAPAAEGERRGFRRALEQDAIPYIGEVCTGGDYAPASSVPFARHLEDFRREAGHAIDAGARLINCLAGSDSWPVAQAIEFFGRALELGATLGAELSFETHRGRPTFHPRATTELVRALPDLRLTCDFSHWSVVGERLVDDEVALDAAVARARHIHARVGYAQGPQVPDPRAPEYARELDAHQGWWRRIWLEARRRGAPAVTMTPEFGPDGYLHHLPFSKLPVADLTVVNRWMAERQRREFAEFLRTA